jgi:maleylpyruvate isomerase
MTAFAWMRQCTDLFLAALGRLGDDELDRPSGLPGWSRRHLLAHVGFNACALRRLAARARTGEPHQMYGSAEQRASEIATGATWDGPRLRAFVAESAAELAADLNDLDNRQWRTSVVTAQGRAVPATEIPWLRTREVAVHSVDLAGPVTFDDLPTDLCLALIDDVVARRSSRRQDPPVVLNASTGRTWTMGTGRAPVSVVGTPGQLARWLTGRGTGDLRRAHSDVPLPQLTPWL